MIGYWEREILLKQVTIKFFSDLNYYAPAQQKEIIVEIDDKLNVEELLDRFPGLKSAVGLILINGIKVHLKEDVYPGSVVQVYPLFGGG